MTSGAGGWRVAIVDTADDMNDNAANALLKMLEEPPARAMLLLLSNTPGRLLPTIRSRCQRLELRPLDDAALAEALEALSAGHERGRTRPAGAAVRRLASARRWRLASGEGAALAAEADRLIDQARAARSAGAAGAGRKALAHARTALEQFGDFLVESLVGPHPRQGRSSGAPQSGSLDGGCWRG